MWSRGKDEIFMGVDRRGQYFTYGTPAGFAAHFVSGMREMSRVHGDVVDFVPTFPIGETKWGKLQRAFNNSLFVMPPRKIPTFNFLSINFPSSIRRYLLKCTVLIRRKGTRRCRRIAIDQ